MFASLRRYLYPQRLAGAVTALAALALLALALRPTVPADREQISESVPILAIEASVPEPITAPTVTLPNVDLPLPKLRVDLPIFETPAAPLSAPPTMAPITSPDASPAGNDAATEPANATPSGGEVPFGAPNGSGRAKGAGSSMTPPVRRSGDDAPFNVNASRSGLVTSLNFCVNQYGVVRDVQLAASSGFRDTDAIAIDWLERQRFKPGTLDGVRVRMCATYDIRWTVSKATSLELQDAANAHEATIRERSRYPRQFVYWPQGLFPGCDAVTVCTTTAR
jgi:outer membrane biosynthesis protein TonB